MKKTVAIFAFIFAALSATYSQSTKEVQAQYQGYDGHVYSFVDEVSDYFDFEKCPESLVKTYALHTDTNLDEYFLITYTVSKNEDGDTVYAISKLEIIDIEVEEIEEE